MNKDVIYIDVEDDITAVIGKVKGSKEKIVALVPPKRIGMLQSAVNLRLLARAATQNGKRLVLISNNSALMALAAAAKVPVAKNLQSKPEIAEISALAVDNGDDIIDGAQLPVGELARMAGGASAGGAVAAAIKENAAEDTKALPPKPGQLPNRPKSGIKVPNFGSFRKKLVLGVSAGVLLVGFLVWAIVFAPHATIIITARTTDSSANAKVTLDAGAATSAAASTMKIATQQVKKDASVNFDATGTKDVGDKAQGQVTFKNCETLTSQTVPAGTVITANGKSYATQAAVTVPGGVGGFGGCSSPGMSSPVGVIADAIGETYNAPVNTTFTVAGHASGSSSVYFNAIASTAITGGTKRQVKVVSKDDIQKAIDQLTQQNSDEMKAQLTKQFDDTYIVLDQTFKSDRTEPQSTPAVDQEVAAGAKAKLASSITYSLSAVTRADVGKFLDDYFAKQLEGVKDQRVYENGAKKATFTNVAAAGAGFSANLVATAKIGPKIDDQAIKDAAKGKRYGDIQSSLEQIQGIDNVDVKFSPFWVNAAPSDTTKISIEFNLNESK